jgi:hypothetical protein
VIPSLELRWMGSWYKTANVVPAFGTTDAPYCGAFYIRPTTDRRNWNYYGMDLSRGAIFLKDGEADNAERANTLSHEFAHHLQFLSGMESDTLGSDLFGPESRLPYEDAIRKFFTESRTEAGALLFSHRLARTEVTDSWLGIVQPWVRKTTRAPLTWREKSIRSCLASCYPGRQVIDMGRRIPRV